VLKYFIHFTICFSQVAILPGKISTYPDFGGKIMNQEAVKLYALSTCGHCKDMKSFLGQCKVNYDCVDVDQLDEGERKQVIEKLIKISKECAFPTLIVGDKVMVGFRKEEIKELLGIS
jgi:glutaredoxin-like protein NrdH